MTRRASAAVRRGARLVRHIAASGVLVAGPVLAVSLASLPVAAQVPATIDSARRDASPLPERRVCFRGQPRSRCDAFWLTEIGFYARAAGTSVRGRYEMSENAYERRDLGNHAAVELGGMVNRDARSALGGTLLLGVGQDGARVGAKARYRYWLDAGGTSADVALGVIRANVKQPGPTSFTLGTGLTGDVSLNAGDRAAVTARVDVVRGGGRTATAFYGGARLGSKPAIIGSVLVAAALAAWALAFAAAVY